MASFSYTRLQLSIILSMRAFYRSASLTDGSIIEGTEDFLRRWLPIRLNWVFSRYIEEEEVPFLWAEEEYLLSYLMIFLGVACSIVCIYTALLTLFIELCFILLLLYAYCALTLGRKLLKSKLLPTAFPFRWFTYSNSMLVFWALREESGA